MAVSPGEVCASKLDEVVVIGVSIKTPSDQQQAKAKSQRPGG
jgi:hypothetical protein